MTIGNHTARNDITGDAIQSRPTTDAYRDSPFWETRLQGRGTSRCNCAAGTVIDEVGNRVCQECGTGYD